MMRGPTVNCSDMPEASLVGGSGPLSRRIGYRSDRAKFRVKSLAVPMLPEGLVQMSTLVADDGVEAYCSTALSGQFSSSWACPACTFLNSTWLKRCEICNTPVDSLTPLTGTSLESAAQNTAAAARSNTNADGEHHDWPSLQEAASSFVDCEISSVGSSWLNVADAEAVVDDESDVLVVNPPEEFAQLQSWAARAKSIAAFGPAVSIPAAGVVAPPLQRVQAPKEGTAEEAETSAEMPSEVHSELDALENRRLHPRPQKSPRKQCRARLGAEK